MMGWVFLAVIKVLGGLTDLPVEWILIGTTAPVLAVRAGHYATG